MSSDDPPIKQFLKLQSRFMAYLIAMTRDFAAAEEVFQNAAVVVLERAAEAEPIADFGAWAKEVVRRQALKYLESRGRNQRHFRTMEPELLDQIDRAFEEDTASDGLRQQEISALESCVQSVPDPWREILYLRHENRMSFAKIATMVNKTECAVQRALSRLRKSLHDCVRSKVRLAEEEV